MIKEFLEEYLVKECKKLSKEELRKVRYGLNWVLLKIGELPVKKETIVTECQYCLYCAVTIDNSVRYCVIHEEQVESNDYCSWGKGVIHK